MCLIIAPGADGKKALLPRDVFNYVYGKNDDGFGAMWVEDGKVNHFKMLGMSEDDIYLMMQEYTERHPEIIFHMRYRTHGKVIPGLCHPFRVLHRSRHGKDLFFMHNGILSEFGRDLKPGASDTTNFKDKILVPLLTRNPDALDDAETFAAINKLTSGSRLIFLDSDGKVKKTSETSWNNRYGLSLSNTYMLPVEIYKPMYTVGTPPPPTPYGEPNVYSSYRSIKKDGQVRGYWCSTPKKGLIRTETGDLYIDQGSNQLIEHEKWFIPKEREAVTLAAWGSAASESAKTLLTLVDNDDDIPFEDDLLPYDYVPSEDDEVAEETYTVARSEGTSIITTGELVASEDERLRYARLVHNCHVGKVACRSQLVADIMCTGNQELLDLIKEDPETAHAMLTEMFEIFIEQNDLLSRDDTTEWASFDPDEMLEQGTIRYHRQGMKAISDARRKTYEEMVKDRQNYPEDTGSRSMEVA